MVCLEVTGFITKSSDQINCSSQALLLDSLAQVLRPSCVTKTKAMDQAPYLKAKININQTATLTAAKCRFLLRCSCFHSRTP